VAQDNNSFAAAFQRRVRGVLGVCNVCDGLLDIKGFCKACTWLCVACGAASPFKAHQEEQPSLCFQCQDQKTTPAPSQDLDLWAMHVANVLNFKEAFVPIDKEVSWTQKDLRKVVSMQEPEVPCYQMGTAPGRASQLYAFESPRIEPEEWDPIKHQLLSYCRARMDFVIPKEARRRSHLRYWLDEEQSDRPTLHATNGEPWDAVIMAYSTPEKTWTTGPSLFMPQCVPQKLNDLIQGALREPGQTLIRSPKPWIEKLAYVSTTMPGDTRPTYTRQAGDARADVLQDEHTRGGLVRFTYHVKNPATQVIGDFNYQLRDRPWDV
jgi:hypothetical protein